MKLSPELRELFTKQEVPKKDWGKPSGHMIAFAHSLVVPAGPHVNTPLRLREFQIEFIRDVYNPQAGGKRRVRQAVLSVARRNGKTLTASVLLLAHLAGPFKKPNSTIVSAATTRKQARLVFDFVANMVRVNPWLQKRVKVIPSTSRIVYKGDGSHYEAISAEAGAQFGMGLDFAIYDELAQAKNRNLYDTLMTSLGSQTEPLMMIISTQAPVDDHILSELIDYGAKDIDPSFVCHCHSVPLDAPMTDERQWIKANPGLDDFRDLQELRETIQRVIKIPSQENSVRVLYLNQRVEAVDPFISRSTWESCRGSVEDSFDGLPVYGGLDLSATSDLTALVLIAPHAGKFHVKPTFWLPHEGLYEKSQHDRVPYDIWHREGFLETTPGKSVEYEFVAEYLRGVFDRLNVEAIGFDDWNYRHLKPWLIRAGFPEEELEQRFLPIRQTYKEMSPALRSLESALLERKLVHDGHPVLGMCAANAVVVSDGKENRMLTKLKSRGRIDGMVALAMAVAVAGTFEAQPEFDAMAMVA